MSQYEIIVSHGLTFALAFAATLKRSSRFAVAISLYCKTEQKDIDSLNLPAVFWLVVFFLTLYGPALKVIHKIPLLFFSSSKVCNSKTRKVETLQVLQYD